MGGKSRKTGGVSKFLTQKLLAIRANKNKDETIKQAVETAPQTNWLKDCLICNTGLCATVDHLKEKGLTLNAACRAMATQSEDLFTGDQLKQRYLYHTSKTKRKDDPEAGRNSTDEIEDSEMKKRRIESEIIKVVSVVKKTNRMAQEFFNTMEYLGFATEKSSMNKVTLDNSCDSAQSQSRKLRMKPRISLFEEVDHLARTVGRLFYLLGYEMPEEPTVSTPIDTPHSQTTPISLSPPVP